MLPRLLSHAASHVAHNFAVCFLRGRKGKKFIRETDVAFLRKVTVEAKALLFALFPFVRSNSQDPSNVRGRTQIGL